MGTSDILHLYNGIKMSLQNLKELKKSDIEDNGAMLNIFNVFNTNGDEKLDKSELTSLFQTMQTAAQSAAGKNSSIFEIEEAEEYVNTTQTQDGQTLKNLEVKAQDLFDFLGALIKTNADEEPSKMTKKDNDFTYSLSLDDNVSSTSEGELRWDNDSLAQIRKVYPEAQTAYYKEGKVIILDKQGNPVCDKNGNPLEVDFREQKQTFSEELAEINVLGHKASPMEKLMHQAEIQNELNRLNSLPPASESYTELTRSIAFQKMDKKEQTEALLKWTGEKFYAAKEKGDLAAMKEYIVEGFGLAFQKMDMASIGSTNISVEGFKSFLKTWSGLNAIVESLDKAIDDGDVNNFSRGEKVWEFTKGIGDAVDSFIGTQGLAFMGTLGLAGEAAAAGGVGEAFAVVTQSYFAFEGMGSVVEGIDQAMDAETAEEMRQSGEKFGSGAIMLGGAGKSFKGLLTGKLQAGMETKSAIKEVEKCESMEEIKELRESLPDLPYTKEDIQAIDRACVRQIAKLDKSGENTGSKPKFGLEEETVVKKEEAKINETEAVKDNPKITNDKIFNISTKEELTSILKDKINDSKMLDLLNKMSDKDFAIMKNAINDVCRPWESVENNLDNVVNLLNMLKEHCELKNRSMSEELNFIHQILSETKAPDAPLIDCVVSYRIPNNIKQLDMIETLLKLRETCNNPLLNIDNICVLASDFKNISDINILTNRLKAKNTDGTYKYGAGDYGKYDVDPQMKTRDLETKKQNLMDFYMDYPEVQQKLKDVLENADEDMINEIGHIETNLRLGNLDNPKKGVKLLLSSLNEYDPSYIKSEINYLLENVEDNELKNIINDVISKTDNLTASQKIKKLQTIKSLLEMHNNLQGKSVSTNSTYWKNYLDELAKDEPELAAKLRGKEIDLIKTNEAQSEGKTSDMVTQNSMSEKALNKLKQFIQKIKQGYSKVLVALGLKLPSFDKYYATEAEVQQHMQEYYNYLKQELSESQKIEQFVEYCKTNKDEISDYLYNEVYLNSRNLTSEVKSKCSEISEQYGVKIFLESDINDLEATTLLKDIDTELSQWKKASNGKAKMPPTLDLTITKSNYIDQESAYGQGPAAGFSEWGHGAISINGQRCFDLKTLRHEMTHTNDLKKLISFNESDFVVKDEQGNIIAQKCKYYDEFVKIGIPEYHIAYAYNNPMEFIAVASEGNLSLCSLEFKQVLIDFGMPEWRFDFK